MKARTRRTVKTQRLVVYGVHLSSIIWYVYRQEVREGFVMKRKYVTCPSL